MILRQFLNLRIQNGSGSDNLRVFFQCPLLFFDAKLKCLFAKPFLLLITQFMFDFLIHPLSFLLGLLWLFIARVC
ncbi:hypothetical protein FGO68_gene14259 [Halteria grandinella]|uniref:Uncharacterized protein n=1 Tax=Halteria grandinella TaxID=5974 RepID=A0A8J8P254_HALGN|nr:hypothetical protein FGO68_gene14259 [Halteria grandinella]